MTDTVNRLMIIAAISHQALEAELRKLLTPLSDEQIERMSAVGEPCADGWVLLRPWEFKRELERARAAGIHIAEQAHRITGGAE